MTRPLALGTDPRNRDFSAQALIAAVDGLAAHEQVLSELVYLDCADDVLVRRFSETRRRHPMAPAEDTLTGIRREKELLSPVRARATSLIDTSTLSPHELREEIARHFSATTPHRLALTIQSFSYKRGLPTGADMVFDCRFWKIRIGKMICANLMGATKPCAISLPKIRGSHPFPPKSWD